MAFKNALNKPALSVVRDTPRVNPTQPLPTAPPKTAGHLVKEIRQNIGKNRFEVYFIEKPPSDVITALKVNKFWWNAADKYWFNKDTAASREFLRDFLSADVDELPAVSDSDDVVLPNQTNGNGTGSPVATSKPTPMVDVGLGDSPAPHSASEGIWTPKGEDIPEPLATYRRQVEELLVRLQIPAADLLLLAISALHRQTFEN